MFVPHLQFQQLPEEWAVGPWKKCQVKLGLVQQRLQEKPQEEPLEEQAAKELSFAEEAQAAEELSFAEEEQAAETEEEQGWNTPQHRFSRLRRSLPTQSQASSAKKTFPSFLILVSSPRLTAA